MTGPDAAPGTPAPTADVLRAVPDALSTAELAAATGYSVQQIRDLEMLGVVSRSPFTVDGYRLFSTAHVRNLRAYRHLCGAVGPVVARQALREIRTLPPVEITAMMGHFRRSLDREQDAVDAAQQALREIEAGVTDVPGDALTGEDMARLLGVTPRSLRFWEVSGLVAAERTGGGSERRYPATAVREARIALALKAAGYGIAELHRQMTALRYLGDLGDTLPRLDGRLADIARRRRALDRADVVVDKIKASRQEPHRFRRPVTCVGAPAR